MKKVLVVLVFVLVAIGLIAPKIIAPNYQEKVAELVANLDTVPGYDAKIESTELAWFGSETKVLVAFNMAQIDPSIAEGKLEAEFIIDTHYGPLLFDQQGLFGLYSTQIRFQGNKQRDFLTWDEKKPLYQLSLLAGFTGNINIKDSIPAFSNHPQTFQFGGYSGSGEQKDNNITYEGKIEAVNIDDVNAPIIAKDISLSSNLDTDITRLLNGSLYNSDTNITVGKLNIGSMTALEGITLSVGTKLDEETQLASINLGYLVKEVTFADFTASDLALLTEFNHLNNSFFKKYNDFSQKVLQQADSPDALSAELFTFMQENMAEFLVSKPEFNVVEFSATMPEGSFEANVTSTLADMDTLPSIEAFFVPEFWLYNMVVNANIEADVPLVNKLVERFVAQQTGAPLDLPEVKRQAQIIIAQFIQQGFIKRENDKYLSELQVKNGQGQVYDLAFPLM